jgi:hypothetical protein
VLLYQAYMIGVDQNQPLTINASGGTDLVGMVGGAVAQNFFLSGGAGPPLHLVSGLPHPRSDRPRTYNKRTLTCRCPGDRLRPEVVERRQKGRQKVVVIR